MQHPVRPDTWLRSPGAGFAYQVLGPCCRLYDRESLPWPCCSLAWRGKMPSWNRVGKRLVPDLASSRCPSYSVIAVDHWGGRWPQVLTLFSQRLSEEERDWWYSRKPASFDYFEIPNAQID